MQNAFAESFIGRLRDELLNETLFRSLAHAREVLEAWRQDYNNYRPHSQLGWMCPVIYAAARRSATLRSTDGSAPRIAATTAQKGITPCRDSNSEWIRKGGKVRFGVALRSARWAHSRSTLRYGSGAEKSHVLLNVSA